MLEFFAFIGELTCVVIAMVAFLHLAGIVTIKPRIEIVSEK